MHLIFQSKDEKGNPIGKMEIVWTWMPYFIAVNPSLTKEVALELQDQFKGRQVNEALFDEMDNALINILDKKHNIEGLRSHLEALKNIVI